MPCASILKLLGGLLRVDADRLEPPRQLWVRDALLGEAQLHLNRHQSLLRAVMEVALQSTALAVRCATIRKRDAWS